MVVADECLGCLQTCDHPNLSGHHLHCGPVRNAVHMDIEVCGEPTDDDDRYVSSGNLVDDAIVDDPAHVRVKGFARLHHLPVNIHCIHSLFQQQFVVLLLANIAS